MISNKTSKCASCEVQKCVKPDLLAKYPGNCPHVNHANLIETTVKKGWIDDPELKEINRVTAYVLNASGYEWCRVKEVIEYCHKLGYKKLGVAFCVGLKDEARTLCDILEKNNFEVISVSCQAGVPKTKEEILGVGEECNQIICNPLMQAEVLNEEQTQLNLMIGLCIGHDILFLRYSKADVTPLIVKDRVLAHNPVGALYSSKGYYHKKLYPESK